MAIYFSVHMNGSFTGTLISNRRPPYLNILLIKGCSIFRCALVIVISGEF